MKEAAVITAIATIYHTRAGADPAVLWFTANCLGSHASAADVSHRTLRFDRKGAVQGRGAQRTDRVGWLMEIMRRESHEARAVARVRLAMRLGANDGSGGQRRLTRVNF